MAPGARPATPSDPIGERAARFLVAMFQGGGNIPLIMPIVAELVARGHDVRVLAGPGIRRNRLPVSARFVERIDEAGATLVPFQSPETHPLDEDTAVASAATRFGADPV